MKNMETTKRDPWIADLDGDVRIRDQVECLVDDIGTNEEWVAIVINDEYGISEVVALAHPINAKKIVRTVNNHEKLLDALILALPFIEMAEHDKSYKAGAVAKVIKEMNEAIYNAEKKA